jgi:hypothetical protein
MVYSSVVDPDPRIYMFLGLQDPDPSLFKRIRKLPSSIKKSGENLGFYCSVFFPTFIFPQHCLSVFRIRIHRIHVFLGLPDPDPLVIGMDPDPALDPDPDPSIIKQI